MCLSIPSKVVEVNKDEVTAIVDTMGVKRKVGIDFIADEVEEGDYVLIHIGYAMNIIDEEDALESIKVYQEILEKMDEEQRQEVQESMVKESDNCPNGGVT
ncbi:HypC/HybG/HupF family hydrogenase formation chaperone [Hydrogenimonas cancrithermarum]|uniref:Hydrogenase formation protein n=1 Tax=Hydrogenimonas cancrithermarum TaxID=2993563 RepID=A0ABM8FLY2_9BACT|nr:HypC/HybG/HupF family hydrogenase formation chaperone [Hydrogenimonas cancrithermarum]BDY12489.1 hydrogenase formation protein [Hydrogenimonas cancrithermarum]